MQVDSKICSKCQVEKVLSEFRPHPTGKHGRDSQCLDCKRKSARVYAEKHKAEQAERAKAWDRENKSSRREIGLNYYRRNKMKINADKKSKRDADLEIARNKEGLRRKNLTNEQKARKKEIAAIYRERNRKKINERQAKYYRKNSAIFKQSRDKYSLRCRNAVGSYTQKDVDQIFKMQFGKCAYCREKLISKFDIDHIVPLSKGGTNNRKNLQVTCIRCNRRKRDKPPNDFAREMGFLI